MGRASRLPLPRRLAAAFCGLVTATTYLPARPMAAADSAVGSPGAARTAVRTIRRIPTSLGDRIVIELTRETAYESGRLAGPERVFFDFANAEPGPALADRAAVITGRLVRSLRVARREGATRVVLDLYGQPRHRAYPLANPFRVVIEVESAAVGPSLAGASDDVTVATTVDQAGASTRRLLRQPADTLAGATVSHLGTISTFTLDRPLASPVAEADQPENSSRQILPARHESLRARTGLGYVQGADWGAEYQAHGSILGVQVQADGLVTRGPAGLVLERGVLSLFDPDRHWRFEAGDLFSYVIGGSRGARVSWQGPAGWRPAIAVVTPRVSGESSRPVIAYRDRLRWRGQDLLDAEVASDNSYYAATRLSLGRVDAEFTYRTLRPADRRSTDRGIALGLELWRGMAVHASAIRTNDADGRSDWVVGGLRAPVGRWLELGFDRTFVSTRDASTLGSAVTGGILTDRFRFSHRYQWGETDLRFGDASRFVAREQYQTMTSWTPGPRLSATLQLVTAWNDHGRAQSWEELQTTVAVSRLTSFSVATPLQLRGNQDRVRMRLVQQFPLGFSVAADWGRVSPFQPVSGDDGRPRARVMLSKTITVATPARGGLIAGRVMDHAGRPVAGARVVLGPYAVTTGLSGEYVFSPLPAGEYELTVDEEHLPAHFAWNGRRVRVDVVSGTRRTIDLGVTPLNAVHGRVFIDRDGNSRFDLDEGVAGVVVRLGDRVTGTDAQGAYSFYNVWPGQHVVEIDVARLPEGVGPGDRVRLDLLLGDDRPATGIDFIVRPKVKPIKWGGGGQ